MGAQIRSVARKTFNLASIVTLRKEGGVFTGRSLLVVPKVKGKAAHDEVNLGSGALTITKPSEPNTCADFEVAQMRHMQMILVAAGASKVHFVSAPEKAQNGGGYDHVVLQDHHKRPAALAGHAGVGSSTWMKQCLIAGRLLPPTMMEEAQGAGSK